MSYNRDKLYGRRWRKLRARFLATKPLCKMCADIGMVELAIDVDHITPHKGNVQLFWDWSNLQGLCKHHHQSTKARIERSGEFGCGADGVPLDPGHHWNVG